MGSRKLFADTGARTLLFVVAFFLLVAQLLLGGMLRVQAVADTAATTRTGAADAPSITNSPAAANATKKSVVVILTDSLNWDYINARSTPALARWASSGTMFNVIPPSLLDWTCPIDLAMAMGAGGQVSKTSVSLRPTCVEPSVFPGSEFLNWASIAIRSAEESPHLQLGSFGDFLEHSGITYVALGKQAAYITANRHGKAPQSYRDPALGNELFAKQVRDSSLSHQLTIVDASISNFALDPDRQSAANEKSLFITRLPDNDPETRAGADFLPAQIYRDIQAKNNAERVDALMAGLEPGTTVVFASLQSLGSAEQMQAGFISNGISAHPQNTVAWSAQVRQTGNITYASLLPTALELLKDAGVGDVPSPSNTSIPAFLGSSVAKVPLGDISACSADSCFEYRRTNLADMALQAGEIRKVRGGFYVEMTWSAIIFISTSCGLLFGVFRHSTRVRGFVGEGEFAGTGKAAGEDKVAGTCEVARAGKVARLCNSSAACKLYQISDSLSARLRKTWVAVALGIMGLTISSVPVASHFVTMVYSWWRAANPQSAIITSTWLLALAIAVATFFLFRFNILLPLVVIGTLTGISLAIDTATGAKVMSDAPMGFNTLLGARFYGLGNEAFALLSTGMLLFAGFVAHWLIGRGWSRTMAALVSAVFPLVASVIGVWPTMGADFGGALAFVPAIAVFVMLVSGRIPSVKKAGVLALCGVGAAFGVAFVDWIRPGSARTHLGNFIQSILDGEASEIIVRKISVNLRLLFTSSHRWVTLAGLALIVVVIIPAARAMYSKLLDSVAVCTLISIGTCLGIAFVMNDSGIVLPGMGFILLLPALAAGLCQIPRREQALHGHREPAQTGKSAQSLA
ncbi:hypothetical protein ACFPH7_08490 [Arcanobacterium bovis]